MNSTPVDIYFPKTTQVMHLPAHHISQALLLYYNPSEYLSKIKVQNVLKGMRQGKAQGLHINRREKLQLL